MEQIKINIEGEKANEAKKAFFGFVDGYQVELALKLRSLDVVERLTCLDISFDGDTITINT